MQIMKNTNQHILNDSLPASFARSLKALPGGGL
jgi:ethanolamine ammonia-lyase large subunit